MDKIKIGNLYKHSFEVGIPIHKTRADLDLDFRKRSHYGYLSERDHFMLVQLEGPMIIRENEFYDCKVMTKDMLGWFRMYADNRCYLQELKENNADRTDVQKQDHRRR
jgi:hypothetical protein